MDNCKEALHRLYQYLDRELTEDEQLVVKRHLDRCPPCQHLFQFEENVLVFIGQQCRQTAAPAGLRERVQRLCQPDPLD